jgi:threonine/homoserine/homoserine lactone efflux protein
MDGVHFAKGVIIGISIAAPVGPIGILCVRRTINDGWWMGILSGLGAACADMIYGGIAAFGMGLVHSFLLDHQEWLRGMGGMFLIILGIRIVFSKPSATNTAFLTSAEPDEFKQEFSSSFKKGLGAFISTFLLTLTNPLTILSFSAMFTGFGLLNESIDPSGSMMLVVGVFTGSISWWFLLTGFVNILRARMSVAFQSWVNRISGGIITYFGIYLLFSIFPA